MLTPTGTLLAWMLVLPFVAVTLYLCLELLTGLWPLRGRTAKSHSEFQSDWKVAVLVPAHNEASGIAATIAHLRSILPRARLLVVADNCTDNTASLAVAAGAEAVERHDPSRRGKGFALAFGREHLSEKPPAAVIVLDADCRLREGSGELLANSAVELERPVQAANLLVSSEQASALEGISNFAMLVKNLVRARGLMRLGGGIPLFGTGMAFPWDLFAQLDLASAALAEDLELGLNLAKRGVRVELLDQALVTSPAASVADSRDQRSRWEHGFLHQAMKSALPLIGHGIIHRSRHVLGLGAHMLVPPIALHLLLGTAILAISGAFALFYQAWGPFLATIASMSILFVLLFAAWLREGYKVLPFKALALAPLYVAWKIPIYVSFMLRRQSRWKRTRRPGEN